MDGAEIGDAIEAPTSVPASGDGAELIDPPLVGEVLQHALAAPPAHLTRDSFIRKQPGQSVGNGFDLLSIDSQTGDPVNDG